MLNAPEQVAARAVTTPALALALLLVAAFAPANAGDSATSKMAPPDLSAKMQEKLDARLNGQFKTDEDPAAEALDGKLSDRVEEKNVELQEQLNAQAESLTAADRSAEKKSEEGQAKNAAEE